MDGCKYCGQEAPLNAKAKMCLDCEIAGWDGGIRFIVVWTEKYMEDELMDDEETHTDHFSVFEKIDDARTHYQSILDMDECYVASLTAVIDSTDYSSYSQISHLK